MKPTATPTRTDALLDALNDLQEQFDDLKAAIVGEQAVSGFLSRRSGNGNGHTNGHVKEVKESAKPGRKPKAPPVEESKTKKSADKTDKKAKAEEAEARPEGLGKAVRGYLRNNKESATVREIVKAIKSPELEATTDDVKSYLKELEAKGKVTQDEDRKWVSA